MSLLNIFKSVHIEEDTTKITLFGREQIIKDFLSDIGTYWRTSKITNNMFSLSNNNRLVFYKFFAVEMLYITEKLITIKKGGLNVRDPDYISPNKIRSPLKKLALIRDELLVNTWLKDIDTNITKDLNFDRLNKLKFKPFEYQTEFLEYYNTNTARMNLKGNLLYADAGTGKTYTSLALSLCLEVDHVFIISPNNAIDRVWRASLDINNDGCLFKDQVDYWISKDGLAYNKEKYIVLNYEYLEKAFPIMKSIANKKVMIILDESHNFNEISALRTQYFIDICKLSQSDNIILMSGTPLKALGKETIPLFSVIDPYFNKNVAERFKAIFGVSKNSATDILRNRLGLVTYRIEKSKINIEPPIHRDINIAISNGLEFSLPVIKEKMKQYIEERTKYYQEKMPEYTKQYFECIDVYRSKISSPKQKEELNKYLKDVEEIRRHFKTRTLYIVQPLIQEANKFEKNIVSNLDKEYKLKFLESKTVYKYVGLKIQGECLGNVLGKERTKCNVELAKAVDYDTLVNSTEKKTVIFTSFVDVIKEIAPILEKQDFRPLTVYGETNKNLNSMITQFGDDPTINPLIATYQSLSTAVPLTMADVLILLNQPFRDYILNQAISRVYRLNATTQIYVYNIYLDTGDIPNISTRSKDILEWSQNQINEILGNDFSSTTIDDSNNTLSVVNESLGYTETFTMKNELVNRLKNW